MKVSTVQVENLFGLVKTPLGRKCISKLLLMKAGSDFKEEKKCLPLLECHRIVILRFISKPKNCFLHILIIQGIKDQIGKSFQKYTTPSEATTKIDNNCPEMG